MTVSDIKDLDIPSRTLLGPGPGMTHPRVLRALSAPTLGHLDPELLKIYGEEQELLRHVFQTGNEWTFVISGTGTSGMEAALANLIEPGDPVLSCMHGYFGARLAEIAERLGASVDRLEKPLGQIFEVDEIEAALKKKKSKLSSKRTSKRCLTPGSLPLNSQPVRNMLEGSTRWHCRKTITPLSLNIRKLNPPN